MKQAATSHHSNSNAKSTSPFSQKKGDGSLVSEINPPFFSSPTIIQNKLTVGQPNDTYEQEADAMADKMVQRLKEPMNDAPASAPGSPGIQAKCDACEKEEQVQQKEELTEEGKDKLQTKSIFESNDEAAVQTKPVEAQGTTASVPGVQAKCDSCEKEEQLQKKEEMTEEGKDKLQTKSIFESNEEAAVQTKPINPGMVQTKCAACEAASVKPSAKEEKIQEKEEPHKEEENLLQKKPVMESPRGPAIQAKAEPGTSTVNAPAASVVQAKLTVGQPDDQYEKEADAVADKVLQRNASEEVSIQRKAEPVAGAVTPLIQSKAGPEEKLQEKKEDKDKDPVEEIQKKPVADTISKVDTIQRSCRECEEGLIFRRASGMVQLAEEKAGDGSRESILAVAKAEIGKVEAKRDDGSGRRIGADRLLEYFNIAAPGVWPDSDIENSNGAIPAWCGIFSVYCHKKAGKDVGNWQMGTGVTAFNTLEQTDNPQPGDIGYIHEPYRHHCIIKEIRGDTVISIDGNSGVYSEVIENERPYSKYDLFFTAFGGSSGTVQRKEEKNEPVQTKPGSGSTEVSSSLEQQISSSKGGGSAMPDELRSNMETNFGTDFSSVRIHTDNSAVQMSKNLNAQAFTTGSDIYFNTGKYDPGSSSGQHLLAHELTHVVQQGEGRVSPKEISDNASSAPSIQKSDAPKDPATGKELIDHYTTLGFLDEEELGQDLAGRLPDKVALTNDVLNRLGDTDRDDVSYEITIALGSKLGSVQTDLRMRFVRELVGGTVSDDEEGAISQIWISFDTNRPEVAENNRDLWKKSLWESDQLTEFTAPERQAFKEDVKGLALEYLRQNENILFTDAQRYGIDLENQASVAATAPGYLEATLAMIPNIVKLRKFLEELKQIKVGYSPVSDCLFGDCRYPATFNPEYAPSIQPDGSEVPAWPKYEEVKSQYDRVSSVISAFANIYPLIYILIQQDRLEEVNNAGDATKAKEVIGEALRKTHEKVKESKEKITTADIEYYDLQLIQTQLFGNAAKNVYGVKFPWEKPYYEDIAKDELKAHEARQFWVDLGLSLLAAAALIAAPFTGGATAAFLVGFGVGIGAAQAGMSWEKYLDMSTAEDATVKDELAIVSKGQVDAQLLDAIISTVAVFLDVYGARAATASAKASKAALEVAEKELKEQLAAAARKQALKEAGKEAALTVGGAGVAIGMHELANDEPVPNFTATTEGRDVTLPPDVPDTSVPDVNKMVIQRAPGGSGGSPVGSSTPAKPLILTGPEFEMYIEKALLKGPIGEVPKMNFVMAGQYTGSGWGIDRIGIVFDDVTGTVSVYHFEMKFVSEGAKDFYTPHLGTPKSGTQTGAKWTENAIDGLLNSQHPSARAVKERLRRALKKIYATDSITIDMMSAFLKAELSNAPIRIMVPDYANLRTIYKQVAALVRWGRDVKAIKVALPK